MVTKEQAMVEDHFHTNDCKRSVGPRGGVKTIQFLYRRNGKTQTWVRNPGRFRIPVKYGFRDYYYITDDNAADFHVAAECPLNDTFLDDVIAHDATHLPGFKRVG